MLYQHNAVVPSMIARVHLQIAEQNAREATFVAKEAAFGAKEAAWAVEKAALFRALHVASSGGQLPPELREHLGRIVETNYTTMQAPSANAAAAPSSAPCHAPANPPHAPGAAIPNTPWSGKTTLDDIWKNYDSASNGKPALRDVFMVHGWRWLTKNHQTTNPNTFQKLRGVVRAIWLERDQLMLDANIPIQDFREGERPAYQKIKKEFGGSGIKKFGDWRDAHYPARKVETKRKPLLETRENDPEAGRADPILLAYLSLT
jgi:hypothetical protein